MDRRDYDWTEHFVYAFSPNWDSWKCMCRYCGITIDIKKEVMSNHLMECPVFNSARTVNRITEYKKTTTPYSGNAMMYNEENIYPVNRLRMGVITDDVSNYSMECYINAAESSFLFSLSSVCTGEANRNYAYIRDAFHLPASRVYSSVSDMFSKELMRRDGDNCQCLLVVSDINMRYQLLMEAIQKGLSIMCSSPLCLTEAEAVMLCKASLVQGNTFHIINPLRFYGMVQIARLLVQSYCLGEITHVSIDSFAFDSPGVSSEEHFFVSGVSNCTSRLGIPAYEVLRFVTVKPVYRLMACLFSSGRTAMDDMSLIRLELEGGCIATLNLSTCSPLHSNDFVLRVVGSCGSLEWTNQRCNELRVRFVNEESVTLTPEVESFRGISIRSYFNNSRGREGYLDALYNMFHCFYSSISYANNEESFLPVTVSEAMESILFLSTCLTSHNH
ncbi:hypothetical protein WA556_004825, partial [Blastocystis sp. ATCC 50177/Nand II]